MMTKTIALLVLILSASGLVAQTPLTGVWNTGTDNTRVEITDTDGTILGTIQSSDNERAPIGRILIKDVVRDDGEWEGQLFAPKRQEWFDATFQVEGDVLEITIGSGFLSRTVEWTRE